MQWFTTSRLSDHQELTPEGFLLVRDVPIARTGQQLYRDVELPDLIANGDGWIAVDREPDEVFRADSIASFPGKPITDDHPMDVVTPDNWSNLAIGVVQNPRRGSGEFHDLLLADLLFTTSHGIQQVRGGKRALSVGYDARYEQDAPGRARQRHIVANHVALVDEGRCGTRCVILDGAPAYNIDAPAHHHDDACGCDACADTAWTADIDFVESEHPRGQPGNAGQFAEVEKLKAAHAELYAKHLADPLDSETRQKLGTAYRAYSAARKAALGAARKSAPTAPAKPAPAPTPATAPAQAKPAASIPGAAGKHAEAVAAGLKKAMPDLQHFKVTPAKGRPGSSWVLASTAKYATSGNPVTTPGEKGSAGVAVRIDPDAVHFYEINNGTKTKGLGAKMVEGVLKALPNHKAEVHVDLSGGFWEHIANRYPKQFHDTAWTADIDFDWIESEHPRVPGGQAGGGEFTSGGGGGTSISSGFEGISGGSGGSGWKQSLPAPPSYVKSFGEKIKAAVAAHQGEPHELVAGIKAIAQAGSHNPNNISYANKVLKHLAAASGQTSGAVGTVKATTAPVGQPPPPPPTPVPTPATAPAQAALGTFPKPNPQSEVQTNMHKLATGNAPPLVKAQALQSYIDEQKQTWLSEVTEAYGNTLLAELGKQHGAGVGKPVEVKGPDPHPDSPPQAEVHKLATDPNTTPVEKILALKDYPTVQSFPTGYTAKFANEWAEAIASAHNIGPLDLKQAEAKAKPAKAASKSKAAPATIANVHGAAAEPPSNIVMAPSTARAEHARFIESKAKQPSSTMDFEADTIAPSLKHEFWQTVDSETKDICTQYGGSFYHTMNGAMRDENAWSAATQKQIDKMDALFFRDEALTTEPVIVRRGENMGPEMKQAIAKWRVAVAKGQSCLYSRAGYTSSSMANQPAFASKELWWHFTVPKGFPMVGLAGHVGHVEREVLFNHGQQTEIYEIWEAGGKTHIKAILRH